MGQQEKWKAYTGKIKQFHGLIRVSNQGRIYKIGTNTSKNKSGILKCTKDSCGYVRMHVSINGKIYNKAVHRLVAETWCPNPKNKPFVDHINAKRDDNRASNLRWVTTAENNRNPHYLKKLGQRQRKALESFNPMQEANRKPVMAESKDGLKLYFNSIQDLQEHFHTKANVSRLLKKGKFVKSSKSALKGWRIRLVK